MRISAEALCPVQHMSGDVWHLLLWLDFAQAEHVPRRLQGLLTLL